MIWWALASTLSEIQRDHKDIGMKKNNPHFNSLPVETKAREDKEI